MSNSDVRPSTTTIRLPTPVFSDLEEVSRHMKVNHDSDVAQELTYAIRVLVDSYVNEYQEDFKQKEGGQLVFSGGDSVKLQDSQTDDGDGDNDDDGKITFSLSEGYSGD